jgi:hypothetical protein
MSKAPATYYAAAKIIYDFWIGEGFSDAFACGMLAQADAESSLNPLAVGDGGKAFGLFQLHRDRCEAIEAGCKIDLTLLPSVAVQCRAALWELRHTEKHALAHIQAATTAYDAAVAACHYYERPGAPGQDAKRGVKAANWHTYFQGLLSA